MSDIVLRPRSATEIVDAAFQVYRREPMQFILGLGLIYVPWLVVLAALNIDPTRANNNSVTSSLVAFIGGMLVYLFASGVTICMADDVYFGRPADVGGAFRRVAAKLGPLVLVLIGISILIGLGFVLLIVPGLYALARYFAVSQAVLLENTSADGAMKRSSQLTKDQKMHVLGALGLVFLLTLAVSFGANMIGTMVPSRIVRLVVSIAATVLVYPMYGISSTLLYYDCRIRNEGFDVEYLAAGVPVAEHASP